MEKEKEKKCVEKESVEKENESVKLVDDDELRARGAEICTFCLGVCCASMRYLLNVLVDYGEVRPTEQ